MTTVMDLTIPIERLRESTRQRLIDNLPRPVAVIALILIKRIEQSRTIKINEALEAFTTDATVELNDEETVTITSTHKKMKRLRQA
uniref:Antitoxin n=1 Tax=Panagrellus redivivus TaxID=6233 RepID=A0A7E4V408_PANRE